MEITKMTMKRCNTCGKEFPKTPLYWRRNSRRSDGLTNICKECKKITDAYYREKNATSIRKQGEAYDSKPESKLNKASKAKERITPWSIYTAFEYRICRLFKLSIEDYTKMMDNQKGACRICGESLVTPESKRSHDIDHDHTTGEARGLLCHNCNAMIGYARESEAVLQGAIKYLKEVNG